MVGGTVIEVAEIPNRADCLWLNCADMPSGYKKPQTCSVLVKRDENSEQVELGDKIWWQSGVVYWTTKDERRIEVKLIKIGGSGVSYETACGREN